MARVLLAFEPPDGGVAEHVLLLGRRLGDHGHTVELAGPEHSTVYARAAAAGLPVHRSGLRRGYGRPAADWRALRELTALLRSGRFDLVHCHSAKAGALGRIAARLAGVPALYSPHCFGWVGDVGLPRRTLATAIEWMLGHGASALIVCACETERHRALERRIAPARRLRRIYYGVEDCGGAAPDPALCELRGEGPLVGAVAAMREQKRLDVLIDAVPAVLARVPGARVAIVGEGPLRADLEVRAAARGLEGDPRFALLGFTPPAYGYLRALDLYVLPSAWEAMPIAVLEALACGVPQVATDVEGTPEACVPATGILVAPGDPGALADAIVALLEDPARRAAMAGASRERHAELFTVDRMVAETAEAYAGVLAA